MGSEKTPGVSDRLKPATTARREWWGWFGSMAWLFFMMYGYDVFICPETQALDDASWDSFIFMLVFALSIAAFGWRFGRDPKGLSRIALFTTPVAVVITAALPFLPRPLDTILYAVAPAFMAPALTRRVYGVIHTAAPNRRLTRYMAVIATSVAAFTVWLAIEPPKEIAMLVPALLSVIAWVGVRRSIPGPVELPKTGAVRLTRRIVLVFIAAVALLFWLDMLCTGIHTIIILGEGEIMEVVLPLLGFFLPLAAFVLFAMISDRGYERVGFICGMALLLIGIQLAYLLGGETGALLLPLAIADGLGGTYTEFFILSAPIYFLINAKRPVFVASLGIVFNLISSALLHTTEQWLPKVFRTYDTPLLATASITTIVFIVLAYLLFVRHREKTLSASLYALLHSGTDGKERVPDDMPTAEETPDAVQAQGMINAGFTQQEMRVALLLVDGRARSEITRKLHISAGALDAQLKSIRQKVAGSGDPDPVIAAVIDEYKITKREAEMLQFLRRSAGNDEIAADLFLSVETVRIHVRNLMKKIQVERRHDIPAWLEKYEKKAE